jgi:hypothetical protein
MSSDSSAIGRISIIVKRKEHRANPTPTILMEESIDRVDLFAAAATANVIFHQDKIAACPPDQILIG